MAYSYPSAYKKPSPMPGTFGQTPQAIPNATGGSVPKTMFGNANGGGFTTPQAYTPTPGFVGSTPKVMGMSAQAGYQSPGASGGSIPSTVSKTTGSTPAVFSGNTAITSGSNAWKRYQSNGVVPPAPGTPESAQAWINKTTPGGLGAYSANNINRFQNGEISYEQLQADAARVGYDISGAKDSGTGTATDYEALARAEYDAKLKELGNTAEGQKAGLTAAWERSNQILGDNRTLEDLQIDRTLNPFSGQTGYQKGIIGRERTLADESARNSYNSALGGIDAGVADAQNAAIDQITARAHQLEQADKQYGLDYAQIYGQMPAGGPLTMAAKGQGFDMGIEMADLTGHLPDGTKTSKQQQTEIENWWKIADQTGVIPDVLADMYGIKHGTPTQSAKQFAQNMSLQWSQEHRMNSKSSGGGGGQSFTSLMKVWSVTGKAPKGLESYGINPGDPYQPGKAAALGAKESADNYNEILDELQSPSLAAQAQRQGVPAKTLARDLLNQNRDNLSDADYKAMNAWINEKL